MLRHWDRLALRAKLTAAEEVQVQVVDGHAGGIAHVEGQPVAMFPDSFHPGDIFREDKEPGEHLGVVPFEVAGVVDVNLRDDQAVDRRARINVPYREGVVVLGDSIDGDFPTVHAAEKAILHAAIVGACSPNVD